MGLIETVLAAIVAFAGAVFYGIHKGKRDTEDKRRLSDLEKAKQAHDTRRRIEDEIDEDVDLYIRAVNAGLVQGRTK